MFLRTLESAAKVIDQTPTEGVPHALESAVCYFSQAANKHTAVEEEAPFARLRQISNAEITTALSRLDELEGEHRRADSLHAEIQRLGVNYLSEGRLSIEEVVRFRDAMRELRVMYDRHIPMEDDISFPMAAAS